MQSLDVLIVDDEDELRSYLTLALQDFGLSVKSASTGTEALAIIHREHPQLVILDLVMPGMAGDQLCRAIKDNPESRNTIVFMLSARADLDSKLACFKSGADEYLVKPIDSRELTARVGRFIHLINQFRAPIPETLAETPIANSGNGQESVVEFKSLIPSESFLNSITPKVAFEPKARYGAYRVENMITRGGMGQVLKGYDELLERPVAIKILSPKLSNSSEFVERFRREAKVLASLSHAGIAAIYSIGEQKGEHYFAMQWCSNGSLADQIRKQSRIEVLPAVDIILQCARGLAAAYKKGIVHRDIKPSNLMFDENQMVKVVDFGLAHVENIGNEITQASDFMGTPGYMAPEQALSPNVDHRADIYSLGITFYHMLYGELPFTARSAMEMVIKHSSQPFPAYDSNNGKIPIGAYTIIQKMVEKDLNARYSDYASLIRDLERLRNDLLRERQFRFPRAVKKESNPKFLCPDFFDLLTKLYNEPQSGVITARWGALEKRFFIRDREIVHFESPLQDENIWAGLVRNKLLKMEDVPPLAANTEEYLNRLLLNQTLSLQDLKKTYRELLKGSALQVFFWPLFEGEFHRSVIERDPIASLSVADLMLESARNFEDFSLIKSYVKDQPMFSTSQFNQVLASLTLRPEESFIASRFDDGQHMALPMLVALTGFSEEKIGRFVFVLEKLGALQFKAPLLLYSMEGAAESANTKGN